MRKGGVGHGKNGPAMTDVMTIHVKRRQRHFNRRKVRTGIGDSHAKPLRESAIADHRLSHIAGYRLLASYLLLLGSTSARVVANSIATASMRIWIMKCPIS